LLDVGLGLSRVGRAAIRERVQAVAPALRSPAELAEAWVSYALSILLGRCRPGGYGGGERLTQRWAELAPLVRPDGRLGVAEAGPAVDRVLEVLLGQPVAWSLEGFLRRHERTYRKRPVFRLEGTVLQIEKARPLR
jgi:hypothetical protein